MHHVEHGEHHQTAGGDAGEGARHDFRDIAGKEKLQQIADQEETQHPAHKALQAEMLADFEKENAHAGVGHVIADLYPAALLQGEAESAAQLRQRRHEQAVLQTGGERQKSADEQVGQASRARMIRGGGRACHDGLFVRLENVAVGGESHAQSSKTELRRII